MNRYLAAFIVGASLLTASPVWADGPQGKGVKNGKQKPAHKVKKAHDPEPARSATIRFQGLDLDGNRVISRAEWRSTDASFRAHDWNRDGMLSGDEVRPDGRRPEQFFRKDWRGDLREFDKADTNRDGVLSAEEFARWR
jgi:EF hand domain-containing protein